MLHLRQVCNFFCKTAIVTGDEIIITFPFNYSSMKSRIIIAGYAILKGYCHGKAKYRMLV
jgi:hypothetical protein